MSADQPRDEMLKAIGRMEAGDSENVPDQPYKMDVKKDIHVTEDFAVDKYKVTLTPVSQPYAGGNTERHMSGAPASETPAPHQLGDAPNTAPPAPTEQPVHKPSRDFFADALKQLGETILDLSCEIDGGEECRGRDQQLSEWIRQLERVQSLLIVTAPKREGL